MRLYRDLDSIKNSFSLIKDMYHLCHVATHARNTVLKRGVNRDLRRNAALIRSLTLCGITRGFYS